MSISHVRLVRHSLCLMFCFVFLVAGVARSAERSFGGVGLQVVPVDSGELVVLKVVSGSTAAVAGFQPGDLILAVDGFALRGSDFGEVVAKRLWGETGSSVELRFMRPGVAGERMATCIRMPLQGDLSPTEGVRLLAPGQ